MKYIRQNSPNGWVFDDYFEYIESIRQRLSPHLFEFVGSANRYLPRGPESLHDSWMDAISVSCESREDTTPKCKVELSLLGPYHDRRFLVTYMNVTRYRIGVPSPNADLLMHEVRFEADNLVHELLFEDSVCIEIECSNMKIDEQLMSKQKPPV